MPTRPGRGVFLSRPLVGPTLTRSGVWPAEMSASQSPSRARSASGATTRRTRASATTPIASRCASTASGAARTRATGRRASRGGSVMARDRQRAKQRKARRAANPGPAPTEPHRSDVPGELDHASGDVDEFDAALVAGAGGEPVDADAADADGTGRAEVDADDEAHEAAARPAHADDEPVEAFGEDGEDG